MDSFHATGPVGVRGREELGAFLSFGVGPVGMKEGESFLSLLVIWESQRRDTIKEKGIEKEDYEMTFWCNQEK